MRHKLTAKQDKFVAAYIECGNATQAALDAGYSKRTARSVGSENLTKPDIKNAINERTAELESHKIARADEVLQFLTSVLRGDATETVNVGTPKGVVTIEDNPPTIKDRMTAGKELLKRYPADDEVLKAQLRKLNADADIAEAHANDVKADPDHDGKVVINFDVPRPGGDKNGD
ncbi:terminase small subunit [Lacticaseibacillus hulanensis]|uniref:terminase small subunit n=1 Tax=Lacticaseibacillus hulanensis TaxID=2493111 RepID=UPI000FDB98F7|nr:terminase small subunit [Lacticaseibacillus hulanensis]